MRGDAGRKNIKSVAAARPPPYRRTNQTNHNHTHTHTQPLHHIVLVDRRHTFGGGVTPILQWWIHRRDAYLTVVELHAGSGSGAVGWSGLGSGSG